MSQRPVVFAHIFHGIEIYVTTDPNKKIHLTGEKSHFFVTMKNLMEAPRRGKIALSVSFGAVGERSIHDFYAMPIQIPPKDTVTAQIALGNHIEGQVFVGIAEIGSPEAFANRTDEEVVKMCERLDNGTILFSYRVMDRGFYEDQRERDDRIAQKLDNMRETIMKDVDLHIKEQIKEPSFTEGLAKEILRQQTEAERQIQERNKKTQGVE